MYRRDRRPIITGIVVGAAALIAVVTYFVVSGNGSGHPPAGIVSDVVKTIPVDGATLSAEIVSPKDSTGAPLLVMPASWGQGAKSDHAIATLFARAGYQVVAYGQRGFGGSTGSVDFAGPATQHDASAVISWALQHTKADPKRVAMLGLSYGAGISLLTAAHDRRVRAVVALSTWADLAGANDQDGTPNIGGLGSLIGGDTPSAPLDATVQHLRQTLLNDPTRLGPVLHSMSRVRSPSNYVDELNANHPAIMLANAFEDSLFNPRQLLPFFDALTTPKRLELAGGDHGGPELSALAGQPNQTVADAQAWLDHYVRGVANGIDTEDPIELREVRTGELSTLKHWPVAGKKDRVTLAAPGSTAQPGSDPNPTWLATIQHAGTDSGATSGPMQFGTVYNPPPIIIGGLKANDAFLWNGPALTSGVTLAGTPTVRLGLSSTSRIATIYLHLYDVNDAGQGRLVDFQPYTASGLRPDKARQVTVQMQPVSWNVPGGDHLALVIDTYDKRYQSLTPAGNSVTVSSTKDDPAWFAVPTGGI